MICEKCLSYLVEGAEDQEKHEAVQVHVCPWSSAFFWENLIKTWMLKEETSRIYQHFIWSRSRKHWHRQMRCKAAWFRRSGGYFRVMSEVIFIWFGGTGKNFTTVPNSFPQELDNKNASWAAAAAEHDVLTGAGLQFPSSAASHPQKHT